MTPRETAERWLSIHERETLGQLLRREYSFNRVENAITQGIEIANLLIAECDRSKALETALLCAHRVIAWNGRNDPCLFSEVIERYEEARSLLSGKEAG